MSRKEPRPSSKPNMGYLVSFGDTMTALLAFFIVLNSLAKEQTGANLHAGTSSFSAAFKDLATPGNLSTDRSDRIVSQNAPSPIYALNESKNPDQANSGIGPDDQDDNARSIDRQQENFKRFLNELDYQYNLKEQPTASSQIVFDSFEPLIAGEFPLDGSGIRLAAQAMPMLRTQNYRLEIIVWARFPGTVAMNEALQRAIRIKGQLDKSFFLTPLQKEQVRYSAKPWLFADAERPILSFVVAKTR